MSRTVVRVVTAALVAGSAAIGFVPVASADGTTTLAPSAASWYQPNPTCAQPTGCVTTSTLPVAPPVDIPLSPYPAGTLHVAYDAGQETARSYLAFPYSGIDGTVTAATLDVPLDVTSADGSAQPETAHVQVCLVSASISSTEGSISPPPQVNCDQHALLSYVATPAPHLHADLAPLLAGLLTTSGIALLPDNTKVSQTDAWHVVFSAASRTDDAKTDPPVMKLAVTATDSTFPEVPVEVPTQAPVDSGVAPVGPAPGPVLPGVVQPVDPVVQPPATQPQTQPVAQPRTITVGYAYPVVWLLPLVMLVLVPMAGRALTRDLSPLA